MSTVVVEPDAFFDCAQSLSYGVHDVVSGALDTLVARLGGCGAMAGSDEGGVAWAGDYDDAVGAALSAGADLDNALHNVVCLLERTGLNHERADAASTPGATMPSDQRMHALDGSFRLGGVPSAAGGSGSAPFGWSLVEHAVGYLWPDGHQDRLHDAAGAWDAAAASLRAAARAIDPIWGRIAEQHAPEVYDAEVVLAGMQNHLHDLAGTFAGLARACRGLAHHIDQAHSDVESALVELTAQSAAVEVIGGALAFFTAGVAEAPTQAVEASRIAVAASRISGYLSSFVSAVRSVVAAVPALGSIARGVSSAVEWLRNARLVSAEVVGVPGLRILRVESAARDGSEAARTGASATAAEAGATSDAAAAPEAATSGEAAAESDLAQDASGAPARWGSPRSLRKHFRDHGADFGYPNADEYARGANAFLEKAREDGLPMKIDDGVTRVYDPKTNTFGSYNPDGTPRTFFKPDRGVTYWNEQPGVKR